MNFSILLFILVLFPFLSAGITFTLGKTVKGYGAVGRNAALIATCGIELILAVVLLLKGHGAAVSLGSVNLFLSFDGLRAIYALVTAFMWLGSAFLSPQYFKHHGISDRYCFFSLFTLGATLGVFLSSNLLTTFIFFEMMSLASFAWVVEEETLGARKAGKTYLTIAVIGGMVTLMGLFLLYHGVGTLDVAALKALCPTVGNRTALYVAAFCILFGFGAKAGMFPVHIWLPKAHPVAPAPASALLSGVLTKTGIFGILVVTANILPEDHLWGNVLLALGSITMFLGALLALFSVNLKRTLACSSMSQIGFITVGISMIALLGEENALAANGTVLYMMNHSIVKLILFLAAGAIYSLAHTLDLNELRGFGRKRPLLAAVFLVGACSLAGIPGTLGYLSKTLVHEAIVEYAIHGGTIITVVEWLFLISGGLTAAYMTKLFVAIFVEKPNGERTDAKKRISPLSWIALLMGTVPILLLGTNAHPLAEKVSAFALDFVGGHEIHHEVHYLAWANLKGVCISLSIAALLYFLVVRPLLMTRDKSGKRIYANRWNSALSLEDLLYVPVGKALIAVMTAVARLLSSGIDVVAVLIFRIFRTLCRHLCELPDHTARLFPAFRAICRFAGDLPDAALLGLRKTALRPVDPPPEEKPKHPLCVRLGRRFDRTFRKNDPNADTAENLIRITETLRTITDKITSNFSFSLLMACFGLVIVLICLLFLFG